MDNLSDKYQTNVNQPGAFWDIENKLKFIFNGLAGFFALSEEDQEKAGIYYKDEGRDE